MSWHGKQKKRRFHYLPMRSQTVKLVRYGRGGNAFCRSRYEAA